MTEPLPIEPFRLNRRPAYLYNLSLVSYQKSWELQQRLLEARRNNPDLPDVLLLLEHPPVYTLGRGATLEFLRFDPARTDYELHRTERGGEVTYHAPGQLVGYPILNLARHQKDLHWYLRQLEAMLITVLAQYGLEGERLEGLTGVWLEGRKVAAIGIRASRWITMHGFALNVCPDLSGFEQIVPCGIGDRPVGSLAQVLPDVFGREPENGKTQAPEQPAPSVRAYRLMMQELRDRIASEFAERFRLEWSAAPLYDSTLTPFQKAT